MTSLNKKSVYLLHTIPNEIVIINNFNLIETCRLSRVQLSHLFLAVLPARSVLIKVKH